MMLLYSHGIRTMVVVYALLNVLWLFVWHAFVWRQLGYSLWQLLADVLPFALTAAATMVLTHYATLPLSDNLWLLLLARVVMAAAVYYLVMRLAGAHILKETTQFVRSRLKHTE